MTRHRLQEENAGADARAYPVLKDAADRSCEPCSPWSVTNRFCTRKMTNKRSAGRARTAGAHPMLRNRTKAPRADGTVSQSEYLIRTYVADCQRTMNTRGTAHTRTRVECDARNADRSCTAHSITLKLRAVQWTKPGATDRNDEPTGTY